MIEDIKDSLLSLLYPRECKICSSAVESAADGHACAGCWDETRVFTGSELLCAKCGVHLGANAGSKQIYCHRCQSHQYDSASSLGVYEKALAATVIELKSTPRLPERVIRTLASGVFIGTELVVPVPLSKRRRIERGFNQAEVIATAISNAHNLQCDSASLIRRDHTQIHRVGMDEKARDLLVRKAFAVARPRLITGKNILLVDDVMTSGATASHCARVLKENGAKGVKVFTLARAAIQHPA